MNTTTGKWFCFAKNHGAGGVVQVDDWGDEAVRELSRLLQELGGHGVPNIPSWSEVSLPDWKPLGVIAQRYLKRRGVQQSTCGLLGIVEMCVSPRILIPYKGPHGRIIHWTGRAFGYEIEGVPKYMGPPGNKPLFMLPKWEVVSGAVMVEGPFDAIAVWQATGLPVVAIGGKVLSATVERDLRAMVRGKLWVMLDGDAQAAALTVQDRLMDQYECKLIMLDGRRDPGDMAQDELRKLIV